MPVRHALADSYAARTGRPDDVGVVGVAAFRERVPDWHALRPQVYGATPPAPDAREPANAPPATAAAPAARAEANDAAGLAKAQPQPGERLGTGHGEREYSAVVDTSFERLTATPEDVVRVRYDSLDNLVAAGIVPRRYAEALPGAPRAFPGDDERGFVPDPPGR
jgi:hypothetical protein